MIAVPFVVHSESADAAAAWYNATMSFDANGGSGAPETVEVSLFCPAAGVIQIADYEYYWGASRECYLTIPDQIPQRDGYTFLGWKLDWDDTLYQPGVIPMLDVSASGYDEFSDPDIVFRAVWISDELSDMFHFTSGSGTIDDPFSGKVSNTNPWEYPDVFYVEVGTEVSLKIDETVSAYRYFCDDGFGLSLSNDRQYRYLEGTLIQKGIFRVYYYDYIEDSNVSVITMHVVDKTADLEFLSDPISDGTITYVS